MPRGTLTVQETSRDGLAASYTAGDATNGHQVDNSGQKTIVHIKNGGGGAVVATFVTGLTVDGLAVADRTVTISAGTDEFIGPFASATYGNVDSGTTYVYIDLDVDTSVTLAALKVGSA